MATTHEVTEMLQAWCDGDQNALGRLTPLVHAELHRLARGYMRRERPGHALQTTALLNEAYMRLIDWKNVRWQNRAHFWRVCQAHAEDSGRLRSQPPSRRRQRGPPRLAR